MEKIISMLTFGPAKDVFFDSHATSPADGGWINATIPVSLDGRLIGSAMIGAWIYTDVDDGINASTHDEVVRYGYAIRPYRGVDRQFIETDDEVDGVEDLILEHAPDYEVDEVEDLILDAAGKHAPDYEEAFAAQLRQRLGATGATENDSTSSLLAAVRALEG
jgi:hypothetical protein